MHWKYVAGVALLLLLLIAWWQLPVKEWIDQFREWIVDLGFIGVVMFVIIYVLITVVLGPASALTLTAGLAYGVWGFPLVIFSATLAAAVAFLLGRYVARDRVTRFINRDPRLISLNKAISDEGWRVVGLMRLSPVIPYGLQNYMFSITQIGFVPYVLATMVGIMPASALYVYIGSLGQAVGRFGGLQWVLLVAGLLATLLVAWFVGKRAKAALQEHTEEQPVQTTAEQ